MQSIKRAPATEGPLFSKMIIFALPIMMTGILQLLYNSADSIIVGRFSGDPNALGAVGCTGSIYSLVVNMLLGLGAGTSVIVSQFFGAKNDGGVSRAVHTSITAATIGGILFLAIGQLAASPLLSLLGTKEELFELALLYLRIVFLGIPGAAVFNFGAAILRALGDSKTPLIILASTGIANVVMNLVFVIGFGMSVAGVALATTVSQFMSGVAVIIVLMRAKGPHKFSFARIGIDTAILKRLLKIGIPSAIQSSLFAISNMILQSSINTFTTDEISGNAVGGTLEGFIYTALNSFYQVTLTFVGQNFGALKFKRTRRVLGYSFIQVTLVAAIFSSLMLIFAEPLSLLFVDSAAANKDAIVAASVERLFSTVTLYVLCGYMETFTGFLRGYGYSLLPMLSSVFCICVLRVLWSLFIFPLPAFNSISGLFLVYPLTWGAATLFQGLLTVWVIRTTKKRIPLPEGYSE